jgi:hypothetical protein
MVEMAISRGKPKKLGEKLGPFPKFRGANPEPEIRLDRTSVLTAAMDSVRAHLLYGTGYVIPSVGNLTERKSSVSMFQFPSGV